MNTNAADLQPIDIKWIFSSLPKVIIVDYPRERMVAFNGSDYKVKHAICVHEWRNISLFNGSEALEGKIFNSQTHFDGAMCWFSRRIQDQCVLRVKVNVI